MALRTNNTYEYLDVTQAELDVMRRHKKMNEYTAHDMAELHSLIVKYLNPHAQKCMTCGGNLREAKNELNQYLAHFEEKIKENLSKLTEHPTAEQLNTVAEQPNTVAEHPNSRQLNTLQPNKQHPINETSNTKKISRKSRTN